MSEKPLWKCPKCGRAFSNPHQPHSCGDFSVEAFLRGKSPAATQLYERFAALVESCGDVLIAPAKTRIGFQRRMIFAAVNRLSDRGLAAHVVLSRRLENPRFSRIEELAPSCFVHHFRIESVHELDDEVAAWLCEAYHSGVADAD